MTVREDPVVRTARREAWVSLAAWLAAMSYSLTCCYFLGYRRAPATVPLTWGVPDWVLWGIVVPWTVCTIVAGLYAFAFVADADLGEELDEVSEAASSEPSARPDLPTGRSHE